MDAKWIKVGGIALACGVVSEIAYFLYKRLRKRQWQVGKQNESESKKAIEEVLFFPDVQVACKDFFVSEDGCNNARCRFTHIPNSLSRLYEFISSARTSIDVCVFVICCSELADLLIEAQKRNLNVRVICDDEQVNITGSQIWNLRREGKNMTLKVSIKLHVRVVCIINRNVTIFNPYLFLKIPDWESIEAIFVY